MEAVGLFGSPEQNVAVGDLPASGLKEQIGDQGDTAAPGRFPNLDHRLGILISFVVDPDNPDESFQSRLRRRLFINRGVNHRRID